MMSYSLGGCNIDYNYTYKKAFKIKKGGSVKIMQVWKKNTSLYIKVKYRNKYGWIKAAGINTSQQFSDVAYAG